MGRYGDPARTLTAVSAYLAHRRPLSTAYVGLSAVVVAVLSRL